MIKKFIQGLLVAVITIGTASVSVLAGVEDFSFKSLEVDYRLSRDDSRRSVLEVKETFVAVFPDYDQNRGIVRELPLSYQGHPLGLQLGNIYRNGEILSPAKDSTENGVRRLELRRGNQYVHGEQTYEINYRLQDVTMTPNDASIQEFYWDINGTEWRQTFGEVRTRLTLAGDLSDKLTGQLACYTGYIGSTEQACRIQRLGDTIEAFTTEPMNSGQTLTIAVGFENGSFAAYEMSPLWRNVTQVSIGALGLSLFTLFILTIRRIQLGGGKKVNGAIVTQYLPPEGIDVMQAATLLSKANGPTATLIDLAVRHQINIKEVKPKKSFLRLGNQPDYKLEIIDTAKMSTNDKAVLMGFMKKSPEIGMSHAMSRSQSDSGLSMRLYGISEAVFKQMKSDEFYLEAKVFWKPIIVLLVMPLIIGGLSLALMLIEQINYSTASAVIVPMAVISLIWAVVLLSSYLTARPKTHQGAEVYHYLQGLRQYIKLAEKDRLAFLQGANTAQTIPDAKSETERRVVLYERVLPYAVLFGLEKSWSKVLETAYQETGVVPTWYIGSGAFSASSFSSNIASFSSYSNSSSSAGSSGGGSAGGGGGGGGGGGC